MTTIEQFQREASRAFESTADVNVITEIKMSRHRQEAEFKVIVSSSRYLNSGHGKTAEDAIRDCQRAMSQEHSDRIEAAKRLLGIP